MSADLHWALLAGCAAMTLLALGGVWLVLLRVRDLRESQRRLIRQLDAIHSAQTAYAQATESAMTHLRDGLQTLTTVCANLDMKVYALELRQASALRQSGRGEASTQRRRVSDAAASVIDNVPTVSASTPSPRALTPAESRLMAAVRSPHVPRPEAAA